MVVSEIGSFIKNRRKSLRVTQPNLAAIAGISVNTLCKVERGQSNPSLESLIKILDVLGLELNIEIKKPGY